MMTLNSSDEWIEVTKRKRSNRNFNDKVESEINSSVSDYDTLSPLQKERIASRIPSVDKSRERRFSKKLDRLDSASSYKTKASKSGSSCVHQKANLEDEKDFPLLIKDIEALNKIKNTNITDHQFVQDGSILFRSKRNPNYKQQHSIPAKSELIFTDSIKNDDKMFKKKGHKKEQHLKKEIRLKNESRPKKETRPIENRTRDVSNSVNLEFKEDEFPSLKNNALFPNTIPIPDEVITHDQPKTVISQVSLPKKSAGNVSTCGVIKTNVDLPKTKLSKASSHKKSSEKVHIRGVIKTNGAHLNNKSNVKPPSKDDVIVMNLVDLLGNTSLKKATDVSPKKNNSDNQKNRIANSLDSSAPIQTSKESEVPKAKKLTKLKKAILKDRECRKKCNIGMNISDDKKELSNNDAILSIEETTSILSDEANHASLITNDSVTEQVEISSISKEESSLDTNSSVTDVKNKFHSRRFREFCSQTLNEEVDDCCLRLLQELVRFQDRAYHKNLTKTKFKRRIVLGLRELTKHLKMNRIQCVIAAPNLEKGQSIGGLDENIHLILNLCEEKDIPCIFALNRRKLGKICKKPVPASVVGIFSYDGANEIYKELLDLSEQARESYSFMLKVALADYEKLININGCYLDTKPSDFIFATTSTSDNTKIIQFDEKVDMGKSISTKCVSSDTNTKSTAPLEGNSGSPYPELDFFIYSIVSIRSPPGFIRKWTYFSKGEFMVYDIGENRYCERIGRNHNSNNIMILADLKKKVYYQKCYDPECRAAGFRSQEYVLPDDVLPYHFLFESDPCGYDFDEQLNSCSNEITTDQTIKENADEFDETEQSHEFVYNTIPSYIQNDSQNSDELSDKEQSQVYASDIVSSLNIYEDNPIFNSESDLRDDEIIAADVPPTLIANYGSSHISTWF